MSNKLPKSVQDQSKRADDLLDAQNKLNNPPDPNAPPVTPPDPNAPSITPPDPNAPPDTPPDPNAPPVTPPATPPEPEYSKEAYLTLQGKYNAEVPRLYSEIAGLKIKMAEMVQQKIVPAAPAAPPVPEEEPASIKYMRKELPEFEGAVTFLANKIAEEKLTAKLKDIDGRVEHVEATTVETAGNIFYKYLDDNVKNWRAINNDPGFLNWLNEPDRYSGMTKGQLLQGSYNKFDGISVANFFNDYITAKNPTSAPAAPPAPDVNKFTHTPPGSTTPPTAPPPEETMSRGDVKKFYDDVASGKYRFKPEDMKKMEEKINRLSLAGKIV